MLMDTVDQIFRQSQARMVCLCSRIFETSGKAQRLGVTPTYLRKLMLLGLPHSMAALEQSDFLHGSSVLNVQVMQ